MPMPAGTTVAADVGDATPANSLACAVDKVLGTTVANIAPTQDPTQSLVTSHSVTLKGCAAGDLLLIKVVAPSGLETTFSFTL